MTVTTTLFAKWVRDRYRNSDPDKRPGKAPKCGYIYGANGKDVLRKVEMQKDEDEPTVIDYKPED